MFSANRAFQIEERFEELIPLLGDKKIEILEGLKICSEDESLAMKFLYTTMPLSDMVCYSFEVFLDYAKHGLYLWERDAWHIPEDIFLNYVLHHRINEEEIMPCRSFFYSQLKDRVAGKSTQEAVLEVNYWCSEEATYQSTDERTVAPLTVYKSAYGRCGEESAFTVSALRSVGIPARQVYAPRWSHCDDNHAWVEVWCEGEWYFLGACEPEEILNKGWFTSASSRAMLIHSRWFDFIAPTDEEEIEHKGMATLLNQLQRYALTKKLTVKVVDHKGKAVSHARVDFEVLNYAEFYPVASVWTNEVGEASLITGLGSLHLHVSKEEQSADILINTKDVDCINIDLSQSVIRDEWIELEVIAPLDASIHTQQPTYSQKFKGKNRCREATQKRLEKVASFQNKDEVLDIARGNAEEIVYFKLAEVKKEAEVWKDKLLGVLTQKDYRDCKGEVLIEHLNYAVPYAKCYEEPIFIQYVLSPRVALEPLTAYRQFIHSYYSQEEKTKMVQNPKYIWQHIEETIETDDTREYPNLITTPVGCLQIKRGSEVSKKILFVAICRTLGIPARLHTIDGKVEYYTNGTFEAIETEALKNSICILRSREETWTYFQNWSIAKLHKGQYQSLNLSQLQWEDGELALNLEPGVYRLITSNRLPNGNIFAKVIYIGLKASESKTVQLELKEAKLSDMLEHIALPDFELKDQNKKVIKGLELSQYAKHLWIWIEESKEPTEHILNEIYEKKELFKTIERQIIFVMRDQTALEDPTLRKVLNALENISIYYDSFEENINTLARRMYVDPDKLPLIIVTDENNQGIYATSGYNVGTADMLLRIFGS